LLHPFLLIAYTMLVIEDKNYKAISFADELKTLCEFENCSFVNCNFSGVELGAYTFSDCSFQDCDMSLVKFKNTGLKTARFINCKLTGCDFSNCNPFLLALNFNGCLLNLASFYKLKLKQTTFTNCNLNETDFTQADLSSSMFENCNFLDATFFETLLEKVDFSTSYNYRIHPEENKIKKAKFSHNGLAGLLLNYDIVVV